MSNSDKHEEDRYEFRGVKLAHELMVDILGALIPGALFLFCIIICIVFPMNNLFSLGENFNFEAGDWLWIVVFLSLLILSYVFGLIFYRADIKRSDRADIRREQKKELVLFMKEMPKGYTPKENSARNKGKQCRINNLKYKEKANAIMYSKLRNARTKYCVNLLLREVSPLKESMEKALNRTLCEAPYDKNYLNYCRKVEELLKEIHKNGRITNKKMNEFRKNILCVLFPDDINNILSYEDSSKYMDRNYKKINRGSRHKYYIIAKSIFPEIAVLSLSARSVLVNTVKIVPLVHSFRDFVRLGWVRHLRIVSRLFRINNDWLLERLCVDTDTKYEPYNVYMVDYLILHMQNESGCATEKRCDFPYISYYKYLLKREQIDILKYAQWASDTKRTKNCINQYKIELQLKEPKAYSIIIKNESHIRMASSSWHVARAIRNLSWVTIALLLIYTSEYFILTFPVSTLAISYFILSYVPQFIHYQRLREIYYTLLTYKLWKETTNRQLQTVYA